MTITEPGLYKTRNGLMVRVTGFADSIHMPVEGHVINPDGRLSGIVDVWHLDGCHHPTREYDDLDLVMMRAPKAQHEVEMGGP